MMGKRVRYCQRYHCKQRKTRLKGMLKSIEELKELEAMPMRVRTTEYGVVVMDVWSAQDVLAILGEGEYDWLERRVKEIEMAKYETTQK